MAVGADEAEDGWICIGERGTTGADDDANGSVTAGMDKYHSTFD